MDLRYCMQDQFTKEFKKRNCYNGDERIKRSGVTIEMTPEQQAEFDRCADDYEYFIRNYCKIVTLDKGIQLFDLFDYQSRAISKLIDNRFVLWKWPRQMGKSISVAAILLWYAIFNETFEIAIMAQKGSQAAEILKRIKTMYENLPWWLQPGVSTWNKGNIILGNGSEIFTGAGELRGRSVNILYWDEYAFVENAYEMYTGNYPIVTSGQNSKLFITSTPNGMNHFYKLWKDSETGKNNYVRDEAFWYEHPKRNQAWKEAQLRNMSERQFDQEFNTQFLGSSDTLISGDALAALTYVDPIGYFGDNKDYRIYEYPVSGNSYVVTVDVSEGIGKDYSVISVIDCTKMPFVQVAMIRDNYIDPLYLATMVSKIGTMYNEALVVIETNSIGKQTSDALWIDLEYENMLMSRSAGKKGDDIKGSGKSQDYGIRTTKRTKSLGCTALKSLIESNNLIIKDFDTVSELSSFSKKGTSFAAEGDKTDDIVMTLVSFAWLSQQPYFADMVDLNVRKLIVDNIQNQEDFNSAFGFFNDGTVEEVDNSWLFPSVRPGEYKPTATLVL